MPLHVTGTSALAHTLRAILAPLSAPTLVVTDAAPDAPAIIAACQAFAAANPTALILLVLHAAPPGLAYLPTHTANAALWAYTRQAALHWAPAGTRINAIGLGAAPTLPFAPPDQATQPAFPLPATPATPEDVARTVAFIAAASSITGQIIRLGV